ncbi:amino acid ABC transporter permease [Yoonia vestfoldensis]|uniref:amino acid ABC transporter permease n=1 Tax=Yoonia vestfoldensis TaxID=245188 RepID=UPI0003685316|nr:amino acid ABC transporter permease [Yoonia vestfoldensis]
MIDGLEALVKPSTLMFLLRGAGMTLLLTAIGCSVGLLAGFVLAYVRTGSGWVFAPLRWAATLFVEVFRRIPFLVTLFLVLYAAQMVVPRASLFWVAVTAICLMSSAYMAEIMRAGLQSVPRAQLDAAIVLNFSRWQLTRMVVLPQAWKVILPSAIAYIVMFVKDTALASQAGVFELMFAGKALANRGIDPFVVFGAVLLAYFAISWPLARFGRYLEVRLSRPVTGGK